MTLLELRNRYESLEEQLSALDVPEETIRKALEAASHDAEAVRVMEEIGWTIRKLDARKEAQKAAIEHVKAEIGRLDERAKLIRGVVEDTMRLAGLDRIQSQTWKFERRGTTSTEIDDLSIVPQKYIREKVELVADKTAIKEAILDGKDVPGAHLETNYQVRVS